MPTLMLRHNSQSHEFKEPACYKQRYNILTTWGHWTTEHESQHITDDFGENVHCWHSFSFLSWLLERYWQQEIGLPGVRFLTGQSGFLAICPVKNMTLNRTISCPVFRRPWKLHKI